MMKKIVKFLILMILPFIFYGCSLQDGDITNTEKIRVESNIYSEDDLNEGIEVVFKYFKKEYKGCELLNIKYVGDDKNTYDDWAKRNNKEESIAFISDFIVHDNSKVQSLNEDKYTNWNWILVRNKGENWILVDNGY
jgi:hypothetical protein